MHAAVAVQAALAHRDRTGEGQLIEVAQLETGANLTAELVLEWSGAARIIPRLGNRDAHAAPQGVYPAPEGERGPEWVALTVADDEQWRALAAVVGRDDWLGDPRLAGAAGRRDAHDELDVGIGAWTRARPVDEAVAPLIAAGIPAARVLSVPWMFDDPQLVARGYYVALDHERTGPRRYPGWPMRFSFAQAQHRFGAPTLGQHNDEILGGSLGLSDTTLAALGRDGVIGRRLGH
jgi:crotonobetainyl-CoA:carnitine CoA-transferase CaiB-like acyl-CoA transferase